MRPIFRFFLCTVFGWKVQDDRLKDLDRFIVVVAPHTSNWDFLVGLAVRSVARLNDVKYLGKDALFKPPYGWFVRAVGGYPVDRSKHNNLVDAVVAMFKCPASECCSLTNNIGARSGPVSRPSKRSTTGVWVHS